MSLSGLAKETIAIFTSGEYVAPSGSRVSIRADVERAVRETVVFRPGELSPLGKIAAASLDRSIGASLDRSIGASLDDPLIEVTSEKTGEAGRRLTLENPGVAIAALNFASARNAGGGFVGGAKAQEEDLCRCSALYACLEPQQVYYGANRTERSTLYTDHIIYSPGVPFFRDERLDVLESPFLLSIVTAPAPNAGAELERRPDARPEIRETLRRRAALVLAAFARAGHRTLVLGAWGCGAFRNDPEEAAEAFALALEESRGHFDRVVFAVWERGGSGPNHDAFRRRFAEPGR